MIEYAPPSSGHGAPLLLDAALLEETPDEVDDAPLLPPVPVVAPLLEARPPVLPEVAEPCVIPPVPPVPVPALNGLVQAAGSAASKEKTIHRRMVNLRAWTAERSRADASVVHFAAALDRARGDSSA
jgi:hypothetical protein